MITIEKEEAKKEKERAKNKNKGETFEYGKPEDSFRKIASLWSTHLEQNITEQDVALMMVLLKVARVPDGKKASRDTMVDIAGYAAIGSTLNWT